MSNIVTAAFSENSVNARTAPVWQYDYGLVIRFEGVELPSVYEVHFANDVKGKAKIDEHQRTKSTSSGPPTAVHLPWA